MGYLTSYLAEIVPFGTIPGDTAPWIARAGWRGTRRNRAPRRRSWSRAPSSWASFLALEDGITPAAVPAAQASRSLGMVDRPPPPSIFYFGHRIACQQADLCLY